MPLSARVTKSSRQAMTCDRVTIRNSPGCLIPVKPMKSCSAFSYARRVLLLSMLANHSSSDGTSVKPWNRSAVSSRPVLGSTSSLALSATTSSAMVDGFVNCRS